MGEALKKMSAVGTMSHEQIHDQLVAQLRELGASVTELKMPGLPTLLVGYGHRSTLLDVEGVEHTSSKEFRKSWRGAKIYMASGLTEACQALGLRILVRQQRVAHDAPKRQSTAKKATKRTTSTHRPRAAA